MTTVGFPGAPVAAVMCTWNAQKRTNDSYPASPGVQQALTFDYITRLLSNNSRNFKDARGNSGSLSPNATYSSSTTR